MKYQRREMEKPLVDAAGKFRVVVLSGARQTGKSTLLRHLFEGTHRYVSFDDPRALKLATEDPELFFDEYKPPVILDEIQYIPSLLPHIKMRVDRDQSRGQFLLTGSQQFTMIKGLQETLAGRAALFQLLPMSVSEGSESTRNYIRRGLSGSYPELVVRAGHDHERWFASYVSTYIEKDVQPFYRLEKITHFRDMLFLLAARCGQLLNYQSLANDLGVSIQAIKLWTSILERSNIIYLLRPYHVNLGSRIIKSPKVYFTDVGLVNYLTGNKTREGLLRGPQAGMVYENFVIQEVLKYYYNKGINPPIFFYRTSNGLELDILIEERVGVIRPCEIKLSKTPHSGMAQHIDRFRNLYGAKKQSILEGAVICMTDRSFRLNRENTAYGLKHFLEKL